MTRINFFSRVPLEKRHIGVKLDQVMRKRTKRVILVKAVIHALKKGKMSL